MILKAEAYVDGSSTGNPGPGGWASILVAPKNFVRELGGYGGPLCTNNQMELQAALEALRHLRGKTQDLDVYCDAQYVVKGMNEWIHTWKKNQWKKKDHSPIANLDLWKNLDMEFFSWRGKIQWIHLPGHQGYFGNERADSLARDFAKGLNPNLYKGSWESYPYKEGKIKRPFSHLS